jgi:HAD superfamily hydrolase (TIGR01493 family)
VSRYRAVLFDWRGTLVHYREPAWWLRRALASLGRTTDRDAVEAAAAALAAAATMPDVLAAERTEDCSFELNRSSTMLRFARAGLDEELADAVHRLDSDGRNFPLYPEVAAVLAAIRQRGARTAIVSDIHYDVRADVEALGLGQLVDAYALSFEVGVQKPDPTIFEAALRSVGVDAAEALMVGDRASHDGGASAIGIATLILPTPRRVGERGLDIVVSMLDPPIPARAIDPDVSG